MTLIDIESAHTANPVDNIEMIAAQNDWSFERAGEDEITVSVTGNWCDYHVSFSWMEELEALHLACAFDLKVLETRRNEVIRLLALVNEQLWLGHFDLWQEEGIVMYRHALLLAGAVEASDEQIEGMMENALESCERFYQAFQFVIWGGKTARESLEMAMMETVGEA
ncbi:type III secretion system chaperone family protein [Methylobrevis albus]|uniref:YbjN domain-containing protein n=1 Tax=Methylobrevis albus TaxID=2793297 RepID=A0A931N0K5_9HYPH|nr:YbjN domain-containing protein [Methylobrevis albus]MBH0239304.1 YbjN domain-containing protein [Methylobrevis albus]